MFLSIIIVGVLLLVTRQLVTYIEVYRFKRRHGCQPAVVWPQKDPFLGLDIFWTITKNSRLRIGLEENTKACLTEARTRTFSTMGQAFVTTCEPENVRALLAVQFHDFGLGSRIGAFGPLLGSGIFTSDDKHWEHSRALIRPSFTRAQVADLDCVESHLQNLIHRLPSNGTTVDLQPLLFNFTIDNSTEFLLGHSVNCQADERMRHFSESWDYAESILQDRIRLGKLSFLQRDRKFTESCRMIHDFIDDYIAKALNATNEHGVKTAALKTKRYNLLSSLAEACRDPVQLRNELLNVLLAARDTTAGLLSSVFYFLARHPDVWRELEAEVHELGGVHPDYDTIKGMKYLRSVIDETLRLHPPVPLNIRYARRNTTLPRGGGKDGQAPVFVAQGTAVHYSAWTMHRLPDVFGPDAEDFRPARWHGDNGPNGRPLRPGWAYLPFNGGPRVCLGQQSALVEASYVVVRLVQEFGRIEARGGMFRENIGLTLSHFDGVKLALWRRDE